MNDQERADALDLAWQIHLSSTGYSNAERDLAAALVATNEDLEQVREANKVFAKSQRLFLSQELIFQGLQDEMAQLKAELAIHKEASIAARRLLTGVGFDIRHALDALAAGNLNEVRATLLRCVPPHPAEAPAQEEDR